MINWFLLIIGVLGGLAIFIYGMNIMSVGLNKAAGSNIRNILNSFTKNRFKAFLTGVISTTIIQSSSAVSVMLISLVKAKLISFPQTFGILLGSGIGTTITAQIIAFKISDYALLFVAIGFFLKIISKRKVIQFSGDAIFGFGLLFFGLYLMSQAMDPIRSNHDFISVLVRLENPLLGILTGFVFTAIIQSSSAFIGILIVLATQGLLTLEAGIPLLLGSNIGTTITAILASIGSGADTKRVAFTFLIIKIIGVLLIFWWIPYYAQIIKFITHLGNDTQTGQMVYVPRQIANAHTLFNIFVTIILLPFSKSFSQFIIKIIPVKDKVIKGPVEIQFLDKNLLDKPALAISLAKKEVIVMLKYVDEMLEIIIEPFIHKNFSQLYLIQNNENIVDFYRKNILTYLTQISQQLLDEELAEENFRMANVVAEVEEIADIISNTLYKKAEEWMGSGIDFSSEGKKELISYHMHTVEQFKMITEVFEEFDQKEAALLKKRNKKLRTLFDDLKRNHFERLSQNIPESVLSSKTHFEFIGALRMINSHISNIIRVMIVSR